MSKIMLNVGSCDLPLPKPWINIDNSTSPHIKCDLVMDGRKLDDNFSENSVDEIYAGHFCEHLYPQEAEDFVEMCYKLLKPGGVLGIVTPDFKYIAQGYLEGNTDFRIAELIDTYIFSYKQESVHRTFWDFDSMKELFVRHGFKDITEIDRMNDERVAYGVPWQVGCEGTK
jgi:predicted SAM-dependent methyltransferase